MADIDVSVVSTAHDVADARLHREVAAFVRAGLRVEVIGLGEPADAPAGVVVRTLRRRGLVIRAVRAVTVPFLARGRVVFTLDPDLVPAATLRCRLAGKRLVVDLHEDYRVVLTDRSWARGPARWLASGVVALSQRLSARADLTVVADDHLPPMRSRRRQVVRNLPDPRLLPPPGDPGPQPRAVYVGDVRRSRGLWAMLEAVEAAPGWQLDVIGPVARSDAEALNEWRASSPAADRVTFHGRLTPEVAWARVVGAWCGFALLEDTLAFREAIPTKVYEYLSVGVPVMTTPLPRVVDIVDDSGAGAVAKTGEEAGATLREWEARPDTVVEMSRRARSWMARSAAAHAYDDLAAAVGELAAGGRGSAVEPTP